MTTAFWCVFIASLIPYLWILIAKLGQPGMDNRRPRDFLDRLEGFPKRAKWAHDNSWESLIFFAVAVLIASYREADQIWLDRLAVVYVLARLGYGIAYILDQHIVRSLVWFIGFSCAAAMYFI